jgi:hypothetical protein
MQRFGLVVAFTFIGYIIKDWIAFVSEKGKHYDRFQCEYVSPSLKLLVVCVLKYYL